MMIKKHSLRNEKLRANRASETREKKKIDKHEKQLLATLKRLRQDDNNELERNIRQEKVVASKKLRLGDDAATKRLRFAMEMDE